MNVTVIILRMDANSVKHHQQDLLANALTKELGVVLVILLIAKTPRIRFADILTCHSIPVSKEQVIAMDTSATTAAVTSPLVDVKW